MTTASQHSCEKTSLVNHNL